MSDSIRQIDHGFYESDSDRPEIKTALSAQAELADHLNVSHQTVNAIEKGKYDPSLPLAFKIAKLFQMQIEEIFFPDDES